MVRMPMILSEFVVTNGDIHIASQVFVVHLIPFCIVHYMQIFNRPILIIFLFDKSEIEVVFS